MDAIRASALLLGIALHASLSFIPGLEAHLWPISDQEKSTGLAVLGFVIHIFRMSVFFLVAGFLARTLLHRLGLEAFVRNRLSRILLPLVLFWVLCFVSIAAIVLWTIAQANGGQLPKQLPAATLEGGLSFLHLWFLYILIWLYAMALAVRALLHELDPASAWRAAADRGLCAVLSSFAVSLLLSLPVALALLSIPEWDIRQGIPTPAYTLLPPLAPLLIYLYLFGIGWLLDRQRGLLAELAKRWKLYLAFGGCAALICLSLLPPDGSAVISMPISLKMLYAACYSMALMSWTFAFVGLGVCYFSAPSQRTQYLADASYWIYVAHLPLIMALQAALMYAPLHWILKYALVNALALAFLLLTYHLCVRSTWIGLLLNGKRRARAIKNEVGA
jgi:glucans biosynthesis protein C